MLLIMKKSKILFIFFLFLGSINSQSVNTAEFDSLVFKGINEIYGIRFSEADETFSIVREKFPSHPAGYFFDAMIYWWKILLDMNNEEHDDIFFEKLEYVIDLCDDILDENENNIDALFFKGGSLGFRGRLLSVREKWFNAALDGKDALPLVFNAYDLDSTNMDVQLGFGIYNYYADVIPERYPFVKPVMFFFPKGDREKGLKQLELCANEGKYAKIESNYFLMTLYYMYEEDYKKAHLFNERLLEWFPDNPVFERYKGRILIKRFGYSQASDVFRDIYNKGKSNKPGYNNNTMREASYYIGYDEYTNGAIEEALKYFDECISYSKLLNEEETSGFLINSMITKARILSDNGMKKEALSIFEQVLDLRDYNGSHDRAEDEIDQIKNYLKSN